MPDFNTRKPQEPSERARSETPLIADKLRILLIGGGIVLFVVAAIVGLLIDSFSRLTNPKQTALSEDPDGTIAFETADETYTQAAEAIWVMNADGSDLRRLTDDVPDFGDWSLSPDGEKIAFAEVSTKSDCGNSRGDCPEEVRAQINVTNTDGSGQTRLVEESGKLSSPDWSPDGRQIAFGFSDADARRCEIYTMNADGSGKTQLVPDRGYDGNPCHRPTQAIPPEGNLAWSPDGEKISFVGAVNFVCVVNADGSDAPTFVRNVRRAGR